MQKTPMVCQKQENITKHWRTAETRYGKVYDLRVQNNKTKKELKIKLGDLLVHGHRRERQCTWELTVKSQIA